MIPRGLSVIVPVKEPEPYVETLVREIHLYLDMKRIPNEVLIQREVGLTSAVVEGVKRSVLSHIVVMDADGSHQPVALMEMYSLCYESSVDLVIGSKYVEGGVDCSPWFRRVISHMYRYLAKFLLRVEVADPLSGFVMGKREWFEQLTPTLGYKFLLQLLMLHPPHVVEHPIRFLPRHGGTSKATLKTGLRTLDLLLKLWWIKYA